MKVILEKDEYEKKMWLMFAIGYRIKDGSTEINVKTVNESLKETNFPYDTDEEFIKNTLDELRIFGLLKDNPATDDLYLDK